MVPSTVALGGIDRSDIVAPAVEGEDPLAGGIVKNRVRIFADLDLAEHLQTAQIENAHGVLAPVADEPAAEFRRQGNAMHSGSIRDIAHGLAGIRVDHDRRA